MQQVQVPTVDGGTPPIKRVRGRSESRAELERADTAADVSFRVTEWSSEDGLCPAEGLEDFDENAAEDLQGWCTEQYCTWPQSITINFEDCVRVDDLLVRAHSFRIPRRVAVYVTGSRAGARPLYVGHVEFNSNLVHDYTAAQELVVHVGAYGTGIRLVMEGCFRNRHNVFEQASLTRLQVFGAPAPLIANEAPARVPSRTHTASSAALPRSASSLHLHPNQRSATPERDLPLSRRFEVLDEEDLLFNDEFEHGALSDVDLALLSVGVPMDIVSGTATRRRLFRRTANVVEDLGGCVDWVKQVEAEAISAGERRDQQQCAAIRERLGLAIDKIIEWGIELVRLSMLRLGGSQAQYEEDPESARAGIQLDIDRTAREAMRDFEDFCKRRGCLPPPSRRLEHELRMRQAQHQPGAAARKREPPPARSRISEQERTARDDPAPQSRAEEKELSSPVRSQSKGPGEARPFARDPLFAPTPQLAESARATSPSSRATPRDGATASGVDTHRTHELEGSGKQSGNTPRVAEEAKQEAPSALQSHRSANSTRSAAAPFESSSVQESPRSQRTAASARRDEVPEALETERSAIPESSGGGAELTRSPSEEWSEQSPAVSTAAHDPGTDGEQLVELPQENLDPRPSEQKVATEPEREPEDLEIHEPYEHKEAEQRDEEHKAADYRVDERKQEDLEDESASRAQSARSSPRAASPRETSRAAAPASAEAEKQPSARSARSEGSKRSKSPSQVPETHWQDVPLNPQAGDLLRDRMMAYVAEVEVPPVEENGLKWTQTETLQESFGKYVTTCLDPANDAAVRYGATVVLTFSLPELAKRNMVDPYTMLDLATRLVQSKHTPRIMYDELFALLENWYTLPQVQKAMSQQDAITRLIAHTFCTNPDEERAERCAELLERLARFCDTKFNTRPLLLAGNIAKALHDNAEKMPQERKEPACELIQTILELAKPSKEFSAREQEAWLEINRRFQNLTDDLEESTADPGAKTATRRLSNVPKPLTKGIETLLAEFPFDKDKLDAVPEEAAATSPQGPGPGPGEQLASAGASPIGAAAKPGAAPGPEATPPSNGTSANPAPESDDGKNKGRTCTIS